MEKVKSYLELIEKAKQLDNSYLLFYKSGSEQSICAYNNIESITQNTGNRIFFC